MLRAIVGTGAAVLVLLTGSAASAQTSTGATGTSFGEQGEFILGVDRLIPVLAYRSAKSSFTVTGVTQANSDSQSSIDLFQNPFSGISGTTGPDFYDIPRAGLDYVLLPNFTIGGNIVVGFSLGGTKESQTTTGGTTTTTDSSEPSYTLLGISPRAGYIFALNDIFAFWPRAGFSFYSMKSTTPQVDPKTGMVTETDSQTFTQLSLDLEGLFVWTPLPHVGITGGPIIDAPLTGSADTDRVVGSMTTTQSASFSSWHIGASVGMITYF